MLCGNVRSNMKVLNNILNFVEQGVGRVDELVGDKEETTQSLVLSGRTAAVCLV